MKKFPLDGSVFEEKDKLISLLKNILLFTAAIGGGAALIYLLYLAANAYAGTGVKFFYPRIFCDFAQVAYCSVCKDAYSPEIGSSYSALSLFILAPFALIFKKDLDKIEYVVESAEWGVPNMQLMSSWRFWVAFLLFYAICFAALFFSDKAFGRKEYRRRKEYLLDFSFECACPVCGDKRKYDLDLFDFRIDFFELV